MDSDLLIGILVVLPASVVLGMVAAAETALERTNDVRIRAAAARGDARARSLVSSVEQPREFLGALTTGRVLFAALIVACFVAVGAEEWNGLRPVILAGVCGGLFVAVIEMTVGRLASRAPEYAAISLAGVVRSARMVFGVPAFLLSLPARVAARFITFVTPRRQDDILSVIEREEAAGGVEEQEQRMIRGVIALEDKTAREIMIPRIDIAAADIDTPIEEVASLVNERGYSRVPIYQENIDDITGIVYAKDLLRAVTNGGQSRPIAELLREPVFIPESKRLDQLLTEMRATRQHMAIVVDEYGGTAGLVTIEDLLEEIVGEIEDEYDVARPGLEQISADEVVLDAGTTTDVLRELFDYEVESEDFDTVGGFLIHELGRLPAVGDEVRVDGLTMRVLSMSGRRVRRLRIAREALAEGAAAR